jgi:hypothetical protein
MNKAVTINGETREIEFRAAGETRLRSCSPAGLYQKRPGQKTWADWLTLWLQPDGTWMLATTTTILNRAGYRLIGWADKATSQHNSALRAA